jgi:hypothetical protein
MYWIKRIDSRIKKNKTFIRSTGFPWSIGWQKVIEISPNREWVKIEGASNKKIFSEEILYFTNKTDSQGNPNRRHLKPKNKLIGFSDGIFAVGFPNENY